jgi:hypothetical protein
MKTKIIIVLIIIIIGLSIIFYLFDQKKTQTQQHLNRIYRNNKRLHNKHVNFINENVKIRKENGLIVADNFLMHNYYMFLKQQFDNKNFESKDVIVRKAGGKNFFNLHESSEYTGLLELFYSNELLEFLTDVLHKPINRPPLADENACSLLIYSKDGDHIDWHYDYSNYYGDRYVVLLTLVNENSAGNDLSENEFQYMHNNEMHSIKMKPNSLAIFKGSEVKHRGTSIGKNEKRILLSMIFCDVCQEKKHIVSFAYEKIKNLVIYN